MATMYSLFFGVLFIVICSVKGDSNSDVVSFISLKPGGARTFLLDQESKQRTETKCSSAKLNQGLAALPKFNLWILKIKNSLRSNSLIFLTDPSFKFLTASQPRPILKGSASSTLQVRLMSPVKLLTIAQGGTSLQSKGSSDEFLHTFFGKKYEPRHGSSGIRKIIISIASAELGVKELTNNNDGSRVEEYLRYTGLGKHHEWCAAFVSWCYAQAGLSEPRNPWSPALFPKKRLIAKEKARAADVFGIYGATAKRINHVGLVRQVAGDYLVSIEGNSNNRVESRRRHLRTVYAVAKWIQNI